MSEIQHPTTATSPNSPDIEVHSPGSTHPSLSNEPGGFDRGWFMGKWGVAWSTLPMWNDKRDVTITYSPRQQEKPIYTEFDSVVEYHKRTTKEGSSPSTVKGVETLAYGSNGASFSWRGKGLLWLLGSEWEVIGWGKDRADGLEWAVTYFSKTLFTPAGLDIYLRRPSSASVAHPADEEDAAARKALVDQIVEVVKLVQGGEVVTLAEGGFDVPGVV